MYYQIHGNQDHSETVLLSSGLGGSHHYWESQLAVLSKQFRVIVYDHFSTGKSPGKIPEGYGIRDMSNELVELLAETQTERVHFIGHALGGLIGLQLALDFPEKVVSLLLINAWGKTDDHTKQCFEIRKSLLRNSGIEMFLKAQPLFLYPAEWMKRHRTLLDAETAKALKAFAGEDNLIRRIDAVANFDASGQLSQIQCPTGIVVSRDDLLVPYSCSEHLHRQIDHSVLYVLEKGGHACNITEPEAFNAILREFYNDQLQAVA
ncbi:pyrimidine utilization protein D [Thiomicrorhabdus sp.]|uniref:pyrimidine utilization protein D n=1 Tax=Thiomicrorhabdus sp. TaxID=2039724 RepID=UPI0029C808BD|nr:pyrimidine utilization protein D [Thiomicrorhabdus sp.]